MILKNFYLISLLLIFFSASINSSQSDTNHFGAGGVFELDLGDSEIPLTPKQEREQKLLEEKLEMKTNETKQTQ